MRYAADHKQKTRAQIIASALAVFGESGYEKATIEDVMAHAGLTRGGFYRHFRSKEKLFVEAILTGATEKDYLPPARYRSMTANNFEAFITGYVGDKHFNNKNSPCPLFAFPSDVSRGGPELHNAYEKVARSIAENLESYITVPDRAERSLAALAMIVGAMVIARSVESSKLEKTIRAACIKYAKTLGATN